MQTAAKRRKSDYIGNRKCLCGGAMSFDRRACGRRVPCISGRRPWHKPLFYDGVAFTSMLKCPVNINFAKVIVFIDGFAACMVSLLARFFSFACSACRLNWFSGRFSNPVQQSDLATRRFSNPGFCNSIFFAISGRLHGVVLRNICGAWAALPDSTTAGRPAQACRRLINFLDFKWL